MRTGTAERAGGRDGGCSARATFAAMAALIGLWWFALSQVYVNASWSDEAWAYLKLPLVGDPRLGERVLFEPPDSVGSPIPYLKTVRGLPGAVVGVDADGTVCIDGVPLGRAKPNARNGRPLEPIAPGTIPPNHYYLHAEHPDSHDSRYAEIGLVPRSRILGRAVALPDIPWLGLDGPLVGPDGRTADTGLGADAGTADRIREPGR